jgi:peptide/nickel transport system permease protein
MRPTRPATERARALLGVAAVVAARTLEAALVVLATATIVFLVVRLLPGDPARLVLGDQASEVQLAALRAKLGLDRPLWLQYAHFLRGLATLDFGESLRRPGVMAWTRVAYAAAPTSALAGFAVALGAALGVLSAVLASGPWLGSGRRHVERVLVVVAARWRVVPLPGDPDAGASALLFSGALLSIPLAAQVGRVGHAALAEIARAPFLAVARAKGAGPARVWLLHAVPAASGPIVTVVATQLGALLGGAVVLERLFERPGLGTLLMDAYATRDLPVLEATVVAAGALFVLVQVLGALVHAAVDPRVRR